MARPFRTFIDEAGRTCVKCDTYKPWAQYYVNSNSSVGHIPRCKSCCRDLRNRPEFKRRERAYMKRLEQAPEYKKWRGVYFKAHNARPDVQAKKRAYATSLKGKEYHRAYQARLRKNSVHFRICMAMSRSMAHSLRGGKGGKHWEKLTGWTYDRLKGRLAALFECGLRPGPDMVWENYGRDGWVIDHIDASPKPKIKTAGDAHFKRFWALSNLAPRWATTAIALAHGSTQIGNIEKSNKPLEEFQKNLAL